jgi:hypothetical protein
MRRGSAGAQLKFERIDYPKRRARRIETANYRFGPGQR